MSNVTATTLVPSIHWNSVRYATPQEAFKIRAKAPVAVVCTERLFSDRQCAVEERLAASGDLARPPTAAQEPCEPGSGGVKYSRQVLQSILT
jgi:hypothetical protein